MIAGLDTVAASLANLICWLARHPDRRSEVVADPSLRSAAIEELLRFTSPVSTGYARIPDYRIKDGHHVQFSPNPPHAHQRPPPRLGLSRSRP